MPQKCIVDGCKNRKTQEGGEVKKAFHTFPIGPLRDQWMHALNKEVGLAEYAIVCSDHFLKSDYRCIGEYRWNLKKGAVPNLTISGKEELDPLGPETEKLDAASGLGNIEHNPLKERILQKSLVQTEKILQEVLDEVNCNEDGALSVVEDKLHCNICEKTIVVNHIRDVNSHCKTMKHMMKKEAKFFQSSQKKEKRRRKETDLNISTESSEDARKDFKCYMCDYTSAQSGQIRSHISAAHEKVGNYECAICQFSAFAKDDLSRHMINQHKDKLNQALKCDLCNFTTHLYRLLMQHKDEVHAERVEKKKTPLKRVQTLADVLAECNGSGNNGPLKVVENTNFTKFYKQNTKIFCEVCKKTLKVWSPDQVRTHCKGIQHNELLRKKSRPEKPCDLATSIKSELIQEVCMELDDGVNPDEIDLDGSNNIEITSSDYVETSMRDMEYKSRNHPASTQTWDCRDKLLCFLAREQKETENCSQFLSDLRVLAADAGLKDDGGHVLSQFRFGLHEPTLKDKFMAMEEMPSFQEVERQVEILCRYQDRFSKSGWQFHNPDET